MGDIACQLNVLFLIFSYRYLIRIVKQDVSCLEDGIIEQTSAYALFLSSLRFILCHPFQPADRRHAIKYPAALCVSRDVTLNKDRAFMRV